MSRNRVLSVVLLMLSFLGAAGAQTNPNLETGFHNFGSYQGGEVDVVNLVHGDVHFKIPIMSYPQRGGKLEAEHYFEDTGKKWGVQVIQTRPASGIGFNTTYRWVLGGSPQITPTSFPVVGRKRTVTTDQAGNVSTGTDNYWVWTPDGSTHLLDGSRTDQPASTASTTMLVVDTSGFQYILTFGKKTDQSDDSAVLVDRKGTHYYYPKISVLGGTTSNTGTLQGVFFKPEQPSEGTSTVTVHNDVAFPTTVVDANGNTATPIMPTAGPGIDTMGRPVVGDLITTAIASTNDFSNCPTTPTIASATIESYPGPNGQTYPVKYCYATVNVATNFSQPTNGVNVVQFPNWLPPGSTLATPSVIVGIVLPDKTSWAIQYDSYLNITSLTYPTGAVVNYAWQEIDIPFCNDGSSTPVSRAVQSRTVTQNGKTYTWTYSWGVRQSDGTITNVVTDPNGNDTAHVMSPIAVPCGFYETQTRSYQGSQSKGTLLKTVVTHYTGVVGNLNFVATNVVPDTITTTLPSGKVSQITRQYDTGIPSTVQNPSGVTTFANVTLETATDWGQGSPGPVIKQTATTYQWQADSTGQYLNAGLLDLPASVIVSNGAGCALSETDYTYDEAAYLTHYTGTLPTGTFGAAPSPVRGNPTSVTRWLAPSGSCSSNLKSGAAVVSHTNWYDTGEVYQQIDPLNNATTHSYDQAYAGAYSTQTCNPLSQCVSGTYDFNTGLLTSLTDANATTQASGTSLGDAAHTTQYAYDGMGRMQTATFPPDPGNGGAQAQTSFNYTPARVSPSFTPFTVQRHKSITPNLTDSSTTLFDGLGRPYQSQHTLPNGTALVDTVLDGLGLATSVSNPYFSTSDVTYGTTQTQYDTLGRPNQITKQDGSVSTVAYAQSGSALANVDCTLTTDEAGKQRRVCNDSLGRLLEVDEPGDPFAGGPASGTLTIGPISSKGIPAVTALTATGSLTIFGFEQVLNPPPDTGCNEASFCQPSTPTYDAGELAITIGGHTDVYDYGPNDTRGSVAQGLANAINNDAASPVTASVSAATITLTARSAGAAGNYAWTAGVNFYDNTDFSSPSFSPTASGQMSGGRNGVAASTLFDSGSLKVTLGSFTSAAIAYGTSTAQKDAASTAAAVANALNGSGQVNATVQSGATSSSATISLTYRSVGTAGNVGVQITPTTSDSADFPSASFAGQGTLSGGVNSEGASLDHNFFVTLYSYDALGNLLNVTQKGDPSVTTSAQWRVRTFTYDSLSRLLTATNPESGTITYSYDANGNVSQKTSPAPNQTGAATQTISYCYDKLNRVTFKANSAQTCSNGAPPPNTATVSYGYDSGPNAIGRYTGSSDQAGGVSFSYDVLGRLVGETRTTNGVSKSMSYRYNLDGSLAAMTYPSGATVAYTPDSAGRALSAIDSANSLNYVTSAGYDATGALTGFVIGNSTGFAGITNSFSFNKRLQPVNMSAASPTATVFSINYDFHFGAGDNGNVWAIANNKDTTRNQSFTYDPLNRLLTAQNSGTDCTVLLPSAANQGSANTTKFWGSSYSYDPWGNLLSKNPTKCSAEHLSVTADANNRIHTGGGTDYQYDAAGNMTSDPTDGVTSVFDVENRIATATKNGVSTSYVYDVDGNRVEKLSGSPATGTLYWYMTPGIVAESDASGNLKSEYVFFDGDRVARKDFSGGTTSVSYYFSDHLKTASVITDASGNIKNESDFYPWGGELGFSDSDSNHYKFTGKERDSETQLDYFGARYYSNGLGRWLTPDWAAKATAVPYAEFSDPQSLNLYGYVRNVPTTRFDVDGHCPVCPFEQFLEQAAEELSETPLGQEVLDKGAQALGALGTGIAAGWAHTSGAFDALANACGQAACLTGFQQPPGGALKNFADNASSGGQNNAAPNQNSGNASSNGPTGPYKRPTNATTPEQRESVQGKPCATCGKDQGQKNNADHIDPLVEQHYRGGIDQKKMRDVNSVRPQCQDCSNQQGGFLSGFSRAMRKLFGF